MKPPLHVSFNHNLALALFLFLSSPALAQLPIHSDAAVQPSAGHFLLREQFTFGSLGRDPTGFDHEITVATECMDRFSSYFSDANGLSTIALNSHDC